jgi:glyoxylate reductase
MARPRVLITRRIPYVGIKLLGEFADVDIYEGDTSMPRGELLERVKGKDGLLSHLSDRIDREVMEADAELKVISTYAVGYNNIDVEEATRRGIMVTNTPGVLREATADLAWALLLACARRLPQSDRFVREGDFAGWGPTLFLGHEVHGRTLGIVGMGDIGGAVARRAKGFDMKVLYHNRKRDPRDEELNAELVSLDELLARSDYISLHVPLTPQTRHIIGEREVSLMKKNAILINTSRGEVVDEKALVRALKDNRIGGAGLDVYENEPRLTEGLSQLHNVVLTPHIGSGTYETRDKMAVMAAQNLIEVLKGDRPANLVNPQAWKV